MKRASAWVAYPLACALAGCASTVPYVGQGPHPQISRGRPVPVVDFIGNVFALPAKLLLWNRKIDRHVVSPDTESYLIAYIDDPASVTDGTRYSLNEYAPGFALKRLVKNHKIAWPYRLLLGLPITLVLDVLLPGRLFGGLLGGDNYNPYTDIVSIYSDHPAVALHEAGHSHDFNKRRFKGTYALVRIIPGVDLWQEYKASDAAIGALRAMSKPREVCSAYQILYPAYGTYIGSYIPFPGGGAAGALVGHVFGRMTAHQCRAALRAPPPAPLSRPAP